MAGVDVDYLPPDSAGIRPFHRAILNLTRETARLAGVDDHFEYDDIDLCSAFAGPAYGVSTPEGEEAIHLLAANEGIFLDPVYSGKAFAAMIGHIRDGRFSKDEAVLFWHTGGVAGLFARH
jgi:1-aminocyclopropane-1-carboxylate deaminase/D-cysteine desulfhydrase-like pyridoxal-dependent ACC family enzyme